MIDYCLGLCDVNQIWDPVNTACIIPIVQMCPPGYDYIFGNCYLISSNLIDYMNACPNGSLATLRNFAYETYFASKGTVGMCYWIDLKRASNGGVFYSRDTKIAIDSNDPRFCTGVVAPKTKFSLGCVCLLAQSSNRWCYSSGNCKKDLKPTICQIIL